MLRKVMVSEYKQQPDKKWMLAEKGEALFHGFGVGYEELTAGVGNFSTAIIEWLDGTISNVPVENVRFLSTPNNQRKAVTANV